MGYAEAKAKDKNLDSYIKNRDAAKKSGDKSAQNDAQNKINAAYGKGTTERPVKIKTIPAEKIVIPEAKKEEVVVKKELTAMEKAKKAIASGDKKAAKESGLKGGLKRQAKRSAGKKDREMARDDRKANKAEGRADKEAEKTAKKESIKAAGSRKAARLTRKSDAAKKAESETLVKENLSSRGKDFIKASKKLGKAEAKTDRVNKRLKNEKTKLAKKGDKESLKTAGAPTTFKSFDQMDSQNAMATAGESPTGMYDGPIKYFKQSIKYNNSTRATAIKVAADEKDMTHASPKGKKELKHDVSSMISHATMNKPMAYMHGSMKGDQSKTKMDYANFKGTDPKYHGKTGASHGDQSATRRDYAGKKGGSILSKHMKK